MDLCDAKLHGSSTWASCVSSLPKQALLRAYRKPPPELGRLAHTLLAALIAIFEKLVAS